MHGAFVVHLFSGSGDIGGGNLKLILGLIWTLILHYQISVGLLKTSDSATPSGQKESGSPKENLLNYLEVIPTCTCM